MNDDYCNCGERWTKVFNTTLYSDCYYCHACDKIYELQAVEVPKAKLEVMYSSDRFSDIRNLAKIIEAKKKVTPDDLVKLGYLNTTHHAW